MFEAQDITRRVARVLLDRPAAYAAIKGSAPYSSVRGMVYFYQTRGDVVVAAEVSGLPHLGGPCMNGIFAFHIHEGGSCLGGREDRYAGAGGHFNPRKCPHPYHAGDMPPLFENDGSAFLAFITDRFTVCEVIGRSVIIHAGVDDFTSQPAGNSGKRIACGTIMAM
ncbi:MAG: superoxide dismutase family protein [Clostridiaceae bacterium]|nr:superoxide dismutase family protein [Eubacteriales bacterium]